ncbi:hypothetical protein [Streptomyces sp. NPDC001774]
MAAPATAVGGELTYGSNILLQNQYTGNGGYLDTAGSIIQPPGAAFDVTTNEVPNSRGSSTSVWKVVSAKGKGGWDAGYQRRRCVSGAPVPWRHLPGCQRQFQQARCQVRRIEHRYQGLLLDALTDGRQRRAAD